MIDEKNPLLEELKRLIDSLEGVPIPFGLHIRIRDLQRDLEKHGY